MNACNFDRMQSGSFNNILRFTILELRALLDHKPTLSSVGHTPHPLPMHAFWGGGKVDHAQELDFLLSQPVAVTIFGCSIFDRRLRSFYYIKLYFKFELFDFYLTAEI
jgi:hypothetical protein